MTASKILAQAADADREADAIFDAIHAGGVPDRFGARPLIPAGFEAKAAQASDLRRRARTFREDAAELTLKSPSQTSILEAAAISSSTSTAGARTLPLSSAPAVEEQEDSVNALAARIVNSESVLPGTGLLFRDPERHGAADAIQSVVNRILDA